jgi:hypothetical protein
MSALFTLDIDTHPDDRRAVLRLHDGDGIQVGVSEVDVGKPSPALWAGLFDARRYVQHLKDVKAPEQHLAELGRFLGDHVLGPAITAALAKGTHPRTLTVRLGDPAGDPLAAAFTRVPWEITCAPGDERTLLDRNVAVRAVPAGVEPAGETSIPIQDGKPVRVLLVFAEAAARPLAARLERERLLDLFFKEVLPWHNVEVDVLCHGVTRRRIEAQVLAKAGYHVVHWSGHGHVDAIEIALEDRKGSERVSGKELAGLLASGGFAPPVVFLSACVSGALGEATPALNDVLVTTTNAGVTGMALDLVRAGVRQVVAMRFEAGDRYTRRLARRFYRRLLADPAHHAVDVALALARKELLADATRKAEYDAVDHANPLVFGSEPVRIEPRARKSAQMERRKPKPQPLLPNGSRELDPPHGFVGRGEELTELARKWLAHGGAAIAMIQGLAGLGKTSLAAEAIHLWFGELDYILCFQVRGGALSIEEFYMRLDQRLTLACKSYRERCRDDDMARVYLPPGESLRGVAREEALRNNLVNMLDSERILLVLDNFDTNLLTTPGADGYASQDPAWDRLFEVLGDRLRDTGSRVLLTSRHKLAALASPERAVWIQLGPLPRAEALIFFEGQRPIRELLHGDDDAKRVAQHILDVSRGHPLILGRIVDLARQYHDEIYGLTLGGQAALEGALNRIQGEGFKTLPDIFSGTAKTDKERDQEQIYLTDVAIGAVDILIERLTIDAWQLLWVITRAGEPVAEDMIAAVWGKHPPELLGELCGAGLLVRDEDTYAFHDLVAERASAWRDTYPAKRSERTEADIWKAYGEEHGVAFELLRNAGKRDMASEAGRRAIRYLVRASAFESLGAFAGEVVGGTSDSTLLRQVIADLRSAATEAHAGQMRWRLRGMLAMALRKAGHPDHALPFFAEAAREAEAAEHWLDLGVTCNNWATALVFVGQLDLARETYLRGANAMRRAGSQRVDVLGSELEVLRVDVLRGRAEEALPAVEEKLDV